MKCEEKLSNFIAELSYNDIDEETVEYCKLLVADYVAASAACIKVNPVMNKAAEEIIFGAGGSPEAHVFFRGEKIPVINAAFMYGIYSHGADIDDGHKILMGHPGAPVISAILPLAENLQKSGKDVITAIVVGYETAVVLADIMQPELVNRGYHSTGVIGAVAAAASASKLLGISAEKVQNALALSMTQAGGLLMVAESGQMSKPINPASAAQSGVMASMLAARDVQGSSNALSSKKGFLHAFAGETDATSAVEKIGKPYKLKGSYFKPYPSCRHTHGAIDCAKCLSEKFGSIDDIEKVKVYIYRHAIDIAGQIIYPKSVDDTKFSIHYATACALKNGTFGINDLDNYVVNCARYEKLLNSIELIRDDSFERIGEGIRGTRMEIVLKDGSSFSEEVLIPKGDPEEPFTWDDMKEKMKLCTAGVLKTGTDEDIIETVEKLDEITDIFELIGMVK